MIHVKNSLGFRGPERPSGFDSSLTIVCVGGSTTECAYLTEGKDWPAMLSEKLKPDFPKVWVNNAGLNGHSTFGHIILMQDYVSKVKPKVVLFLVGVNDVGRSDIAGVDSGYFKSAMPWYVQLMKKSELYNLYVNYRRKQKAAEFQMTDENMIDRYLKGDTAKSNRVVINSDIVKATGTKMMNGYKTRLQILVDECKKASIDPVFITQPLLLGDAIDSATGLNFANVQLTTGITGLDYWNIMQVYNSATKEIANNNNCLVIDLADSMPKTRAYYYDMMHYTNKGADYVSTFIALRLKKFLSQKYPQYNSAISPVKGP
nr:SGNH/GDSL hydrolase family protein [uncultured Lacibacter sp.]